MDSSNPKTVQMAKSAAGKAQLSRAAVLRARFVHGSFSLLLMALGLLAVLYLPLLPALSSNTSAPVRGSVPAYDHLQTQIARHQIRRLQTAIRTYKLTEGQLPETLRSLTTKGLLRESDLRYPYFQEDYLYATEGEDSFTLAPPPR